MTALTIELPPELFDRLIAEAARVGKAAEAMVEEWLDERLPDLPPDDERARARAVLRAAGLLVEDPLGPELRKFAYSKKVTLEEVSDLLTRAGGPPLSEIIIEQRGPRE